jgi:acetyl esterase/lipase
MDAYHFIQQRLNGKLAEELDIKNDVVDTQKIILFGGSAGGTSVLCLVRLLFVREKVALHGTYISPSMQAADIEKYNSESEKPLPQVKAILCAYPLTDPNSQFAQPKSAWAEKVPKMFPDDWELVKDYGTATKVCTGYDYPVGRYVSRDVESVDAAQPSTFRWDTCRDPRFRFYKTVSVATISRLHDR